MFDKQEQIEKMKPYANKLVSHFQKNGIEFSPTDGEFENVIFTSKDKEVKISHHSFYRFSGIASIHKDIGGTQIEVIEVTNEMFMNNYMKPIVEILFGNTSVIKK
jgi:hypothetical protein